MRKALKCKEIDPIREKAKSDPAAAFDAILKKYQDKKGVGGQDMLPDPNRSINPVMVTSSSKIAFSKYIRNRHPSIAPNRITTARSSSTGKVEGAASIPKPEHEQKFVPVDSICDTEERKESPGGYNKIIERVVKGGERDKTDTKMKLLQKSLNYMAERYRKLYMP